MKIVECLIHNTERQEGSVECAGNNMQGKISNGNISYTTEEVLNQGCPTCGPQPQL
jgi:uncharacterized protein (UPF0212 family)